MRYQDIVGAEDIIDVSGEEQFDGRGPLEIGGIAAQDRGTPQKARQTPLGFPTTEIVAEATANVVTTTQVLFRGRRLVIPSDIAADVLVNDLRIGKNSQFPSSGPVPGRVFSEAAVGVDLSLDTAQVSQSIALNVTNTDTVTDMTFNAALLGDSLE